MVRTPRKKIKLRWVLLGSFGLLIGAVVAGFLILRPGASSQPPVRTQTIAVSKTTEKVTLSLTGTLASAQQAELSFGASGTVTSVSTSVGQSVTRGTTLATIDDTALRDGVSLASAQLTAAKANLTQVNGTSGATSAQIASAKAQVNSAQAKLTSAQSSLASARITAPFDGTVAAVNVSVGNQASGQAAASSGLSSTSTSGSAASQSAIVLIEPGAWIVNGSVGPADIGSLKVGQAATLQVQGTTVTADASVATVGVVATTSSGSTSFPVTLEVSGSPANFYYGASVNVTVNAGNLTDILTVPTNAITTSGAETTVQLVVDGQPVSTPVTLGKVFGDRTQVTSGLNDGDHIQITVRFNPSGQRSGAGFPGFGGAGQPRGSGEPVGGPGGGTRG